MESGPKFTLIAATGEELHDFAPYVAAIDDEGLVAFQATLRGGETGVFAGSGGALTCVARATRARRYDSHPDIARDGAVAVYCRDESGASRVVKIAEGRACTVARSGDRFSRIGPLGPTIGDDGLVAFRADTASGPGIFVGDGEDVTAIAHEERFVAFHGLPVLGARAAVVFRADTSDGVQGIFVAEGGQIRSIASTRDGFDALGAFPFLDAEGGVTFTGQRGTVQGVFTVKRGELETIADTSSLFESVRGGLRSAAGAVFYATPRGGSLGVYIGSRRLVGLGDAMLGARVTDLALNPVSINAAGQLAVRLGLDDGRQIVVRVEPSTP